MSEQSIYQLLRAGGLSPAGACAMMGNMQAESGCISFRMQGDFSKNYQNSRNYTAQIDDNIIDRNTFVNIGPNGGGYGLCQWTFPKRKDNLYAYAKASGISIGDEAMQCNFCINELQIEPEYKELYSYLCETTNLAEATEKICLKYERPQIPNVKERLNYAMNFFNLFAKNDSNEVKPVVEEPAEVINDGNCLIKMRPLRKGDVGHDVFVAQCGLFDLGFDCDLLDGDFGNMTQTAVKAFQQHYKLDPTGIVGKQEWDLILKKNLEV